VTTLSEYYSAEQTLTVCLVGVVVVAAIGQFVTAKFRGDAIAGLEASETFAPAVACSADTAVDTATVKYQREEVQGGLGFAYESDINQFNQFIWKKRRLPVRQMSID